MKGWGLNGGASSAITMIVGEPVGPDMGVEVNMTIPTDENGVPQLDEDGKTGGLTVAPPFVNWSFGFTLYGDISYTESLSDFKLPDPEDIQEAVDVIFNKLKENVENFDMGYEEFSEKITKVYEEYLEKTHGKDEYSNSDGESPSSKNSDKQQGD